MFLSPLLHAFLCRSQCRGVASVCVWFRSLIKVLFIQMIYTVYHLKAFVFPHLCMCVNRRERKRSSRLSKARHYVQFAARHKYLRVKQLDSFESVVLGDLCNSYQIMICFPAAGCYFMSDCHYLLLYTVILIKLALKTMQKMSLCKRITKQTIWIVSQFLDTDQIIREKSR